MQPYSPEVPWVTVTATATLPIVECAVCGESVVTEEMFVDAFAKVHLEHRAPEGTLGFGDAVSALAKPMSRMLGRPPCTPCEARRRALNSIHLRRFW